MNCDDIEEKIADWVTRRLPADEVTIVDQHLGRCTACREFGDRVAALYAIEDKAPIPLSCRPLAVLVSRRRNRALRRVAAAAIVVAIVCFAVPWRDGSPDTDHVEPTGAEDIAAPLPYPDLSVDWPELPAGYPESAWLTSEDQVTERARLTGKPVLEEYYYPDCPRCRYMQTILDAEPSLADLDGFVLFRVAVRDVIPDALVREELDFDPRSKMPAIRIVDGSAASDFIFEVSTFAPVAGLRDEWFEDTRSTRKPIASADFMSALEALKNVERQVQEGAIAAALRSLERVIVMQNGGIRSGLIDSALSIRAAILAKLEVARLDIQRLMDAGGTERRRAIDLARRMARSLEGVEAAAPFLALAD